MEQLAHGQRGTLITGIHFEFLVPLNICGKTKATAVKFCIHVGRIKLVIFSCQVPLKWAWSGLCDIFNFKK